ncbi:MAG: deoxyguanosinetriphosphate triphosphohydrolase [Candidatus Omnitrophota bacterium]
MWKVKPEQRYSEKYLAPYAMKSEYSKGRKHKEPEHPYRSMYQRDRERIIHTTAFRRLEYKTQVFVNHEGDHYRTRLTHTLEVAQIARTIARALSLNEDLAESIALAHDLGHTPFGHSGEDTLTEIMREHGGFEHNIQGLRVVDLLEDRYPEFSGLNLTYEVREGIVKHNTSYDKPPMVKEFASEKSPTLEAQVVDIADEIAYYSHDLDDGISSRVLDESKLESVEIWSKVSRDIRKEYPVLNFHLRRYMAVKMIINMLVTDLIDESRHRLEHMKIHSIEDVRKMPVKIIDFSSAMNAKRISLRDYLFMNFYKNYRVIRMAEKAKRFIKKLFDVYLSTPDILPPYYQAKIKEHGDYRVICDYIAGMTDRYALDEYKKFFEPYERV